MSAPKMTTAEIADLNRLDTAAVMERIQALVSGGGTQIEAARELIRSEGCTARVAAMTVFAAISRNMLFGGPWPVSRAEIESAC